MVINTADNCFLAFSKWAQLIKSNSNQCQNFIDMQVEEAIFGLNTILESRCNLEILLKKDANILEVGGGSGILSTFLSQQKANVHMCEPFVEGFCASRSILETCKSKLNKSSRRKFHFYPLSLSQAARKLEPHSFDFIFGINVLEHFSSEELLVCGRVIARLLKKTGVAIFTFNNSIFPYEPHFKIPVVLNKPMTYFLFKRYINEYEKANNCRGAWQSLNFINTITLNKIIHSSGCYVTYDKNVLINMFQRCAIDKQFGIRHPILTKAVRALNVLKLSHAIKILPIFLHPYVKAVIYPGNRINNLP